MKSLLLVVVFAIALVVNLAKHTESAKEGIRSYVTR